MHVVLGHGASGNSASMRPVVDALGRRAVASTAIDLPKGRAEAAVPAYRAAVEATGNAVHETIIGGQSFGGRVASLLAVEQMPRGLVLFCYPLHAPGKSDGPLRVDHWRRISCPVLLLSGESDPLARIELLREAVKALPDAELVTYQRVGHGLAPVLEDAMDEVARFVSRIAGPTSA